MSGTYRYADRPLPGGSVKNRSSAVYFGRRRPIEEEIDRRQSIEEEKGKKKRKRKKKEEGKKEYLARAPSSPACRRRLWVACAPSPPAGCLLPLFLPREEMERLPARGERSRR
ncbi:hypothetical protein BHM03_00054341, partial [Ensete ventricosum]